MLMAKNAETFNMPKAEITIDAHLIANSVAAFAAGIMCCVMLCYAVLCCVVLCCVVLCCVMLCYVVLCCAVLRCVM